MNKLLEETIRNDRLYVAMYSDLDELLYNYRDRLYELQWVDAELIDVLKKH